MSFKTIIKKITPPFFLDFYYSIVTTKENNISWTGNYKSWEEAREQSTGYDSELILDKVKSALLKVKDGRAVYERDSVLFNKIQYSFPLLSALMWITAVEKKTNIIDFGGSLGSSYFQNRLFVDSINSDIKWNVVEQEHFVSCGKLYFESEKLKFYKNVSECFQDDASNVIIFSSVLQYLEAPSKIFDFISGLSFKYIIIDLTGIVDNTDKSILTVQKIPSAMYKASYPCWFFKETELKGLFSEKYDLIYDFDCEIGKSIPINSTLEAKYKGYFYKRK